MKVGRWSTTPGNNNATPPDGWPEGQAASTVNDCAREMMASIRTMIRDTQYIDKDQTPTYISTTSFSIPGNATSAIHAGRRLKLFDAATVWATISTASYTTVTTVHLTDATGNLSTSLSSFAVSVLSNENNALPRNLTAMSFATLSVSATAVISTIITGKLQALSGSLTCVAAGGFICTGDVTAFSDARLKTDWRDLPADYLERLAELRSGIYTRIDSGYKQVGLNAQDFQELLPEAVHGSLPEYLSIAYGNAAMVTCVELARRVLALEKRVLELTR